MGYKVEIERKFLIHEDRLPPLENGAHLVQGYLGSTPTVRVRARSGTSTRQASPRRSKRLNHFQIRRRMSSLL